MRNILLLGGAILLASPANAQNSTTDCYSYGSNVQCKTQATPNWMSQVYQQQQQIQQQNDQNTNQLWSNIGAAMAAQGERKRQKKAAAAQADALAKAYASDTAILIPRPSDEEPITLACESVGGHGSMALFEKHGRIDITDSYGVTKTRSASFSTNAVTWTDSVYMVNLNRLDGSMMAYSVIPEFSGQTVTGTCALATQRKF